ncbi:hypothetical protein WJX81_006834 [Elliptochloris bilobata]|uniref:Integral membrane protein n=1 Tax=Elliptochloris bilobata TaxID=381761 RepID=A0AAW1REA6_9CHLO
MSTWGRFPRLRPSGPEQRVHTPRYRFIGWDPDNVSYWVATLFTLGSVAWIVNGFYLFLPTGNASVDLYASGYSALLGGTLFTIGAYLAIVEALNIDRVAYFGYHVHRAVKDGLDSISFHPKRAGQKVNPHYDYNPSDHRSAARSARADEGGLSMPASQPQVVEPKSGNAGGFVRPPAPASAPAQGLLGGGAQVAPASVNGATSDAKPRAAVMCGASLFQLSVVAGVPNLIPLSNWQLLDALVWTPQVVGAMGFIIASGMLMLETQKRWWEPKPLDIGWHVAFWNLVGAIGFWLSAFFGYFGEEYQHWGTAFSTFWGAWAFLIGSYLQLLEALNKHPMSLREVFTSQWLGAKVGLCVDA